MSRFSLLSVDSSLRSKSLQTFLNFTQRNIKNVFLRVSAVEFHGDNRKYFSDLLLPTH